MRFFERMHPDVFQPSRSRRVPPNRTLYGFTSVTPHSPFSSLTCTYLLLLLSDR